MNINLCEDPTLWDAYIDSKADASHCHLWGWRRAVEKTFGHEAHYLAAMESGVMKGVLPLVRMRSRMFGHFVASVPFSSYGGVLASDQISAGLLIDAAENYAREIGARHVELRQGKELRTTWERVTPKVTIEVELPATVQALSDRLSPKMRKRIRYARKNGLRPKWGEAEAVADFYPVFAANMRNLGTPVYPRKWFENIADSFPGKVKILSLEEDGVSVASAFIVIFRDTVELPWAGTLPQAREKFSPLLLYWTLLEWACENGYSRVDLGRCTPGSGNHDFKKRWGGNEKPLHWYYWLAPGATVPDVRPTNPRYRVATQVWKHLPLAVANLLGPRIVRSIP